MIIESVNLDDIYIKASLELGCSANEVEIKIIQAPTNGVLGFFRKNAIVEATRKNAKKPFPSARKPSQNNTPSKQNVAPKKDNRRKFNANKSIDIDSSEIIAQIKVTITSLLKKSCFNVELMEVKELDDGTIYIKIDGEDAPLLIGKEGYRYKALSYLIYNMFKSKFNVSTKLEVAQFLEKQEIYIDNYLLMVKEKIEKFGRANTRVLDGVLLKLALEKLRASYTGKYVGIKTNRDGEKYIVINNFNSPKRS